MPFSTLERVLVKADVLQRSCSYGEGYLTQSKALSKVPIGRDKKSDIAQNFLSP